MKKSEVKELFNSAKTYCIAQDEDTASYFLENGVLWKSVEDYYSNANNVSEKLRVAIRAIYSYLATNRIVGENDNAINITHTDEPPDVAQLNSCFYDFSCFESLKLYEKFEYETKIDETTGESRLVLKSEQPQINEIANKILEERNEEALKLESYTDWLFNQCSKNAFLCLIEDRGKITQTPSKKEIVKIIYKDCGIYDLIIDNCLDVHVPSYWEELR